MHRVSNSLMWAALVIGLAIAPWAFAAPGVPGEPHGAYLGVMVDKVTPEAVAALHLTGGTLISTVDQDGPASQAGMKPGDIVSAFNGKPVTGPDQFASMIHSSAAGTTVTLTVWRNGHSQDMKVKLGNWSQMAAMPAPPPVPHMPLNPVGAPGPLPPIPPADVDMHTYTPMVARSGILVEPLSAQLAEYFGVPANQGVLVRTVEKGGPGAAAGLRAGDVILRVNNEAIHDMADWKRALKAQSGKVSLQVMRDKHEMTLQMVVPANTSELKGPDWDEFNRNMQAMSPEMKKQVEEMQKQAEQMSKELAKMAPEWEKQAKELAESMKPSAKELSDWANEFEKQWKEKQPELQKQMEEFQKEWNQQMQEWQKSQPESLPKQM